MTEVAGGQPARGLPPENGEPEVIRNARLTPKLTRELSRAGARDGRMILPDPAQDGPLSTGVRDVIVADLEQAIRRTIHWYGRQHNEIKRSKQECLNKAETLRSQLSEAKARLAEVESGEDGHVDKQRYFGEDELPESTIIKRRTRERDRRVAPWRDECDRLGREIHAAELAAKNFDNNIGILAEDLDRMRGWLVAVYRQRCAIYDEALLRRHPLRALVDGRLADVAAAALISGQMMTDVDGRDDHE